MRLLCAFGWLAISASIATAGQAPRPAQASTKTVQSSSVSATFAYVSDGGCVQNQVVVFANLRTASSSKAPQTTADVTYSRHRYDDCDDADLGTDIGTSSRPAFSGDLNKALLNATVEGHTPSGSAVAVSFALVWEGKGAITRHPGRLPAARADGAKPIASESLSRSAAVSGSMDGEDISDAVVSGSLHTSRKTTHR